MLNFQEINPESLKVLSKYYKQCNYRICEYSVGIKLMWHAYLRDKWCETNGCLVVINTINGVTQFDFPVPSPEGDISAALDDIDAYCTENGIRPVISVVPEEMLSLLTQRYPYMRIASKRPWQDYLYTPASMIDLAGKHFYAQRNNIHQFYRENPNAEFRELTPEDDALLQKFWQDYQTEFSNGDDKAQSELKMAKHMLSLPGSGMFRIGGLIADGRLVAVSLGEKCGDTLMCHIQKALYSCKGAYSAIAQAFNEHFAKDCKWINWEDDASAKGLRVYKQRYMPAEMLKKYYCAVESPLDAISEIPRIDTPRLTLDALSDSDMESYNTLCLDDDRNRWWGYDYRKDLKDELRDDYFLNDARRDFRLRNAINWAVRIDGKCIGEVILYNQNWKGAMELGCRIAREFSGHGYGAEAFSAAADWALYQLGLNKVVAKCYSENLASLRMLSSCMKKRGEDETFIYFEKTE